MDLFVFLAVLAAAACHAGWNALLKLNVEPIVATCLVAAASGVVAVPFAIFVGLPSAAAWPYVLASVAIHIVYYLALAQAYRLRRPRARSIRSRAARAPLMTAVLATLWLGEALGPLRLGRRRSCWPPASCCWPCAAGGRSSGSMRARSALRC